MKKFIISAALVAMFAVSGNVVAGCEPCKRPEPVEVKCEPLIRKRCYQKVEVACPRECPKPTCKRSCRPRCGGRSGRRGLRRAENGPIIDETRRSNETGMTNGATANY